MYYQAFPSFSEELDFAVVGVLSELLAVGHKAPAVSSVLPLFLPFVPRQNC